MELVQEVTNPVEEMALKIAEIYLEESPESASKALKDKIILHRLTNGEVAALTHVVTCMIHGKPWKKNPEGAA